MLAHWVQKRFDHMARSNEEDTRVINNKKNTAEKTRALEEKTRKEDAKRRILLQKKNRQMKWIKTLDQINTKSETDVKGHEEEEKMEQFQKELQARKREEEKRELKKVEAQNKKVMESRRSEIEEEARKAVAKKKKARLAKAIYRSGAYKVRVLPETYALNNPVIYGETCVR